MHLTKMKHLGLTTALSVLAFCSCTTTQTDSRPAAQDHLLEDGKLLYELGRFDEARTRFNLVLAQTTEVRFRTNASYYLDRIEKGLLPEYDNEIRRPKCFVP